MSQRDIQLNWKTLELKFESLGFLKKSVHLDIRSLCIDLPKARFRGCTEEVSAHLVLDFFSGRPRMTEVTPFFVRNLKWYVGEGRGGVQGWTDLQGDGLHPWSTRVRSSVKFFDGSILQAQGRVHFIRPSILHPQLSYHLHLNYHPRPALPRSQLVAELDGTLEHDRWSGALDARAERWVPGVPQLSAQGCHYVLSRKAARELSRTKTSGELKMFCSLQANLIPLPHDDYRKIPNQLLGTLELRLESSDYLPQFNTALSGEAQIVLNPIRSAIVEGGGQVNFHLIGGRIGKSLAQWKITTFSALRLEIPEFQRFTENFKRGPWAVPAPFNVLRGSVALHLEGEADWKVGSFPFHLSTHLHSSTQVLKLRGSGYLIVSDYLKRADWRLGVDAVLTQVQIEFPRLDWAKPPRLVPDSRFYESWPPEKPSRHPAFHYRISVRTEVGHPALILSNFSQRKIPVTFQVLFSDSEAISGMVRLASFPVEIFNRKAQIESLQLTFRDPLTSSLIFGSMQTTYADYKITIQLGANLERPQVHLISEPALPESQIASVLLFGRPLDELTSSESSSVGNTRAAIADQALGLASLYVLASTPVQSLAYDPATGIVSARVKLGEGISLNLGTNVKESAVVELQQRLGSNWSLHAGVGSSEGSRGSASASLQWSRRY